MHTHVHVPHASSVRAGNFRRRDSYESSSGDEDSSEDDQGECVFSNIQSSWIQFRQDATDGHCIKLEWHTFSHPSFSNHFIALSLAPRICWRASSCDRALWSGTIYCVGDQKSAANYLAVHRSWLKVDLPGHPSRRLRSSANHPRDQAAAKLWKLFVNITYEFISECHFPFNSAHLLSKRFKGLFLN